LDHHYLHGGVQAGDERPTSGWIRALPDVVEMTSCRPGRRIGTSQPAATQFERSEVTGVIRLDSLTRVADALDCDLVYALVPRTTLDQTVRDRADLVAHREIQPVDAIMQLDDHGLTVSERQQRTDEHATWLIGTGRLWDELDQR
jgi:predicted DNA-binding mobile mystery protein A